VSVDVRGSQVFQAFRRVDVTIDKKVIGLLILSSTDAFVLSSMPQGYRHVPKPLTPVFSLFCVTQRLWGSSEPGGRQTAGITKNWDGGWALSHATLHDSMRLKRQKGHRCVPRDGEHRCVPRDGAPWTRE